MPAANTTPTPTMTSSLLDTIDLYPMYKGVSIDIIHLHVMETIRVLTDQLIIFTFFTTLSILTDQLFK